MLPAVSCNIDTALDLLRHAGVVAIPTETVYGLAADASNPDAVKKIYHIKGRPASHPLIVHVDSAKKLTEWAVNIPDTAYTLAKHFWPGPLTFILSKAPWVNNVVTGGQNTIGLRCPNHPLTLTLLNQFDGGVAAPSANRFGHISPTKPEHVMAEFKTDVDLILDGGQCDVGIESTIVDLTGSELRILREGIISAKMIEAACQQSVLQKTEKPMPQVSGSLDSHYAPDTSTQLVDSNTLLSTIQQQIKHREIAVVSRQHPLIHADNLIWFAMPQAAQPYAHELYDALRQADESNATLILVEAVPTSDEWTAIRDRIVKATN